MIKLVVAITLTLFAGIASAQAPTYPKWWPIIKAAGIKPE